MIFNNRFIAPFFFLLISFFFGCSYSFTGASVPPHLQTVAVSLFQDRSGSGEPDMPETFTNELIQKFVDDNTLTVREKAFADAIIEGTITSLRDAPAIVGGGEDVTTRRITVNVKVVYKDLVKKKVVFDKSFSNFGDYSNSGDIVSQRRAAISTAIDKITEDILLAVVANW